MYKLLAGDLSNEANKASIAVKQPESSNIAGER